MSPTTTLRTPIDAPETVARAVRPDNTPEIETRVEGDAVVTDVERDSTSGLRSTVDDYVVNLSVAAQAHELAAEHDNNE